MANMEFEKLLKDLEDNLAELKRSDLTLNETLVLYEKSISKLDQAKTILQEAELKFEQLSISGDEK